jgi:type IV pilus assembly protein PilW
MNTQIEDHTRKSTLHPHKIRIQMRFRERHSQAGFSLVELMVSLTISLFMILGAIGLYVASSSAFRGQQHLGQLMENGRAASEIMSRTIRLARYWGCTGSRDTSVSNHLSHAQQGIYGLNGATDEITVYQALTNRPFDPAYLVQDIDDPAEPNPHTNPDPLSSTAMIKLDDESGLDAGDYVLINDCAQADIFALSHVDTANHTLELTGCGTCTQQYQANAGLYKIKRSRFYITTGASGEPALFLQEDAVTHIELIEGVEDMQIYYGEDTDDDGTVNRYVLPEVIDAACIQDGNADCWRGIASVRISLLLRTVEDSITKSPQTYTFNGASVTANDRRLRREFLTIISLRNHRS